MEDINVISPEFEKFNKKFLHLKGDYRFSRLGKTFETKNNKYFLDSGTGKVFQLNENLYKVLECLWNTDKFEEIFELGLSFNELLDALREIEDAVKNENILQMPVMTTMCYNNGDKNNQNIEDTQMKHLSIEMTEHCNLRCKYCIYHEDQGGFRTFGKKDITFDVIKKAIDLLSLSTEEEVVVAFYGGEPLIKFDLIKECVEYCDQKLVNKKVSYVMTTNATLINEEVANYLASLQDHFITVSLDGPELIHNKNRVFIDGTGSFEKTMKGLEHLIKAEGDKAAERINFNIVLDDETKDSFEQIQEFFSTSKLIPNNAGITTSYVSTGNIEYEYLGVGTEKDREISELVKECIDPLSDWNIDKVESGENKLDNNTLISRDFVDKELNTIHKRMLIDKPAETHYMNGCCVPGARKLYLTVNGDFAVCERIGPSPFIGNVDEGLDFEKIKKHYITDFTKEALKYCNDCWAVHMCGLCYTNCYDNEGLHMSYRHRHCLIHRQALEGSFIKYHELLEENPQSLAYLDGIEIV